MARLLPGLPVEAVDLIHGKSRGNPLFALEYARLLRRQGHLWQGEGGWYWREPGPDPAHPTLLEAVLSVALQPVWPSRGRGEVLLALGSPGEQLIGRPWPAAWGIPSRVCSGRWTSWKAWAC